MRTAKKGRAAKRWRRRSEGTWQVGRAEDDNAGWEGNVQERGGVAGKDEDIEGSDRRGRQMEERKLRSSILRVLDGGWQNGERGDRRSGRRCFRF